MNNFHFIIDDQIVDDLDAFVPEERHFSPSDPAYALMDLHRGFTNRRPQPAAPSHATSHRHSSSRGGGSETERSSAGTRYTGSRAAPTTVSNLPAGISGFLEAPPSRVSGRSYGSDHSTIRATPSNRSAVASIHSGVPSVHSGVPSVHSGVPSVHSFAPSRHTERSSPSYVSHAASQRTEVYAPSRQSHASSRHTGASPASHVSSRHTETGPSSSRASSRHTDSSGLQRTTTHSGSGVSPRRTGSGSIRRSSTFASGSSTLSGYDTVGPEDSISSVSVKSRGSRREADR